MTFMTLTMIAALWQAPAAAPLTAAPQIAVAVQAAPEERRADATVMGYDDSGKLVTLRQGKNDLICLADNPKDTEFEVNCYKGSGAVHGARPRAVGAGPQGQGAQRVALERDGVGQAGDAEGASTLYILEGKGYDSATGAIASRTAATSSTPHTRRRKPPGCDDAGPGRAMADVPWQAERAHHDRPAAAR